MSSFEWMELQTLTSEIAAARSRLAAARSKKDIGRSRALEEEIRAAEGRRDRLLAHISTNLATAAEPASLAAAKAGRRSAATAPDEDAASDEAAPEPEAAELEAAELEAAGQELVAPESVSQEPVNQEPVGQEPVGQEPVDRIVETAAAPPAPVPKADSVEGGIMAWDQLTPGDIDRAKHDLGVRRAEMLARHAAELQGLEADQVELDTLERAIEAFAKKFAKGAVVELEAERGLRQQGSD
ncbi:MAG TPA: hypothetical protein VND95_08950 [Stellaceae bacterium]|nr:hypothetical protein [Stellaceae bacterium]